MPEAPLPPGSTIGILGGGQLGRMLAVAASRLGFKAHIYSDEAGAPAFDVGALGTIGAYEDEEAIAAFAASTGVVTCEFENVPARALEIAARASPVFPPPNSFAVAQDRLMEKDFIAKLGIPVAPYAAVGSLNELRRALAAVGSPALLKTRRFGYDGKGQVLIHSGSEADSAWQTIGGVPSLLENIVRFEREISVLVVRGQDGTLEFYDPIENVHQGGILAISRVPARIPQSLTFEARRIAGSIAQALRHVGVLAIEMFEREGESPNLIVNEIAPRVHNSGHWTIEGAITSQFENHVRAILGLPLGDTSPLGHAAMLNLIGKMPRLERVLRVRGAHYHDYGKSPRPGRKLGHCTVVAPTPEERDAALEELVACLA